MIQHNIPLKQYNTFGMDVLAKKFAAFESLESLKEVLDENTGDLLVLGGGSNMLLRKDVDALVLKNNIPGIDFTDHGDYTLMKVGAGENWHQTVMQSVKAGLGGMENLALIPGNTGASPMQNIGAYGVEIRDIFYELEAWDIHERTLRTFNNAECAFGYRESVFKNIYRNRFIILNVTFRLNRNSKVNTNYGAISLELEKMNIQEPKPADVANAVISIRSSKLPDPTRIGNAGSFFKNPVIPNGQFNDLKAAFPDMVAFPMEGQTKLAAGWLIEQCGWKGYREGDAGCYPLQALVLVNYANATGEQIYDLSEKIITSVQRKFGVTLEREVNII